MLCTLEVRLLLLLLLILIASSNGVDTATAVLVPQEKQQQQQQQQQKHHQQQQENQQHQEEEDWPPLTEPTLLLQHRSYGADSYHRFIGEHASADTNYYVHGSNSSRSSSSRSRRLRRRVLDPLLEEDNADAASDYPSAVPSFAAAAAAGGGSSSNPSAESNNHYDNQRTTVPSSTSFPRKLTMSSNNPPSTTPSSESAQFNVPLITQEVTLESISRFGHGCSITHDTLAVTSNHASLDDGLVTTGVMFLYDKHDDDGSNHNDQDLVLQGNFTNLPPTNNHGEVAVEGNTLVVGPCDTISTFCIFERPKVGDTWTLLQMEDIGVDVFSVAIGSGTIAIGSIATSMRRVVLYNRNDDDQQMNGTTTVLWTERQTVTSGLPGFGYSVKVLGDTMVVGTPYRFLHPKWRSAGTVFVYKYNTVTENWVRAQDLRPSVLDHDIRFGHSVALADNGNLIVVGAPSYSATPTRHGYVSIWEKQQGASSEWTETTNLLGDGINIDGDRFGWSLDTDGNRILVSDFNANVFVYLVGEGFPLQGKLKYAGNPNDVAILDGQACVAVPASRTTYVLRFLPHELLPTAAPTSVVSPNITPSAIRIESVEPSAAAAVFPPPVQEVTMGDEVLRFGHGCSITADTLAVTSNNANLDGLVDTGAMFLYDNKYDDIINGRELVLQQNFTDLPHRGNGEVAMEGNTLVVGPCNTTFSFCIFERPQAGGTWTLQQVEDIGVEVFSVAIDSETIAVGSTDTSMRRVIVYNRNSNDNDDEKNAMWTKSHTIMSGIPGFGYSVKVLGDTIVVGAPFRFLHPQWRSAGTVFVYKYNTVTENWVRAQDLRPSVLDHDTRFGHSVALADNGNLIVVGAPSHSATPTRHGYVSIWEKQEGTAASEWTETTTLLGEGSNADGEEDRFGWSLDTDGNRILVSDFNENVFVYLVGEGFPLEGKLQYAGNPNDVAIFQGQACVAVPASRTTYVLRFPPYELLPTAAPSSVVSPSTTTPSVIPNESLAPTSFPFELLTAAPSVSPSTTPSVIPNESSAPSSAAAVFPPPVHEVTIGDVMRFGHGCAITNDTLIVTSNDADIDGLVHDDAGGGAMFLYDNKYDESNGKALVLQGNYTNLPRTDNGEVAIEGNTLVIGPCNTTSSFCIFERPPQAGGSTWTLLQVEDIGVEVFSVAIDSETIAVGSIATSTRRVVVYNRNDDNDDHNGVAWTERQIITSGLPGFGYSVKVLGDTMVVAAPFRFLHPQWRSAGTVFVYKHNDATKKWSRDQELRPKVLGDNIRFGHSVALADNGNLIVVGAPSYLASPKRHGYVSIWEKQVGTSSDWAETTTLVGEGIGTDGDRFGWSVDTDGVRILVSDFDGNVFVYLVADHYRLEGKLEYLADPNYVAIFEGQACVAVPASRTAHVLAFPFELSGRPSPAPSFVPSLAPSEGATSAPTDGDHSAAFDGATDKPTLQPYESSDHPSLTPTDWPSPAPSLSHGDTDKPTLRPYESSDYPSLTPTDWPSPAPSLSPSSVPSAAPTEGVKGASMGSVPSPAPTEGVRAASTGMISWAPNFVPSLAPSEGSTSAPTDGVHSAAFDGAADKPTIQPHESSDHPSLIPTDSPSPAPSLSSSSVPSAAPTEGVKAASMGSIPSPAPTEGVRAASTGMISYVAFDAGTDELTIQEAGMNVTSFIDVSDGDSDPTNEQITAMNFDKNTGTFSITEGGKNISTTLDVDVNDDDTDPTNELITNVDYDSNTGMLTITEGGVNHTTTIGIGNYPGTHRQLADDMDATKEQQVEMEQESYETLFPRLVLPATVPILKETSGRVFVTYGMDGATSGHVMVLPGHLLGYAVTLDEPFTSLSYVEIFVAINNDVVVGESAMLGAGEMIKSVLFVDPVRVHEGDNVRFLIEIRGDSIRPRKLGANLDLLVA